MLFRFYWNIDIMLVGIIIPLKKNVPLLIKNTVPELVIASKFYVLLTDILYLTITAKGTLRPLLRVTGLVIPYSFH